MGEVIFKDDALEFQGFDLSDDDFASDEEFDSQLDFDTRYIKPRRFKNVQSRAVKYHNAKKMAQDITLGKNERVFCVISGAFIAGDFIEAFCVEKNLHVKKMVVQTLSLSQNNVDSLHNLLVGDYVDSLSLIVSDYFYSHERRGLLPYIYQELDIDDKFQLSAAGTHCKIAIWETHCGQKYVLHGSANLRSSANIEQFVFEESEELYNFIFDFSMKIEEKYKTINKAIRVQKLWATIK